MSDINIDQPTLLYDQDGHKIYWLGIEEDTVFRCNTYLISDGIYNIIVDPGGRNSFDWVKNRVEQIIPSEKINGLILCHQDPDVAASMVQWLSVNPAAKVYASPRAKVLLPYFGAETFDFFDIEESPLCELKNSQLEFLPAPFLHSPMAIATYDKKSGFLFTGDIFAAIDSDWKLYVEDFDEHINKMNLFHIEYMASNIAANGFVNSLDHLKISALLPQHGSIIPEQFVSEAMDYLRNLDCGIDILYPDLI